MENDRKCGSNRKVKCDAKSAAAAVMLDFEWRRMIEKCGSNRKVKRDAESAMAAVMLDLECEKAAEIEWLRCIIIDNCGSSHAEIEFRQE